MGQIRNVVIVGGGTAGWMTASLLAKHLDAQITLIESPDVPPVGVGEATIIHMTDFLKDMGLSERDWMRSCNATYKEGIRFEHFYERGARYWHPFQDAVDGPHITNFWIYRYLTDGLSEDSYFDLCYGNTVLNATNRIDADSKVNFETITDITQYTYQLEAVAFGQLLRDQIALPGGVVHIVDEVTDVTVAANGDVDHVVTRGHGDLTADLFVDCSGFRSLLLEQALGEAFVPFAELPNDRAIAVRLPYEDKERELHPYTTATALDAGWVWNIPLYSRIGVGYVYSSHYRSEREAEQELRAHLGEARVAELDFHHLRMRVGRHRRLWRNNVVAIGLAGGFVEPLESTGIELSQVGAELLLWALAARPDHGFVTRELYNHRMQGWYDEILDFLQLHYLLTNRDDSEYWRDQRYPDRPISDALREKLFSYRQGFAQPEDGNVFKHTSWHTLLIGMRYIPTLEQMGAPDPDDFAKMTAVMERHHEQALARSQSAPSHYQFLREHIYDEP